MTYIFLWLLLGSGFSIEISLSAVIAAGAALVLGALQWLATRAIKSFDQRQDQQELSAKEEREKAQALELQVAVLTQRVDALERKE